MAKKSEHTPALANGMKCIGEPEHVPHQRGRKFRCSTRSYSVIAERPPAIPRPALGMSNSAYRNESGRTSFGARGTDASTLRSDMTISLTLARRFVAAVFAFFFLCSGAVAYAAEDSSKHFDIKAQPLAEALTDFGAQSGLTVVAPRSLTAGKRGASVSGDMTSTDALARLLKGSGLTFARLDDVTIAINNALDGSGPRQARSMETSGDSAEEVVVTGTRIAGVTNLTSPSPIAIASHEDIVLSKATSLEQILGRIPGLDFNGGNSESNNNGSGTSTIALRNLGPQRTLVLIDGRRLIPQFGSNVNLNIIPLSMIDHVEVLKDGASSIYGADAIGGVINLITKEHADGFTLDGNYGMSGHGDGESYGISSTVGANTDHGNVLLGLNWTHRAPVAQSDRDWAIAQHADDPNYPGGSAWRAVYPFVQNEYNQNQIWVGAPNSSVVSSPSDPSLANRAPNLAFIPRLNRVVLNSGGGEGWNFLNTGLDQKQISISGHHDITDNVTAVAQGFFTDSTDRFQLGPDALNGDRIATRVYRGFIIPATNPYNLTGSDIAALLIPQQLGHRRFTVNSETYRIQFGFEGDLGSKFNWETGYVYQTDKSTFSVSNQINYDHAGQLTGQAPCKTVPGGCTNGLPTVPVNFFNGPDIFTQAQIDYLTYDNISLSYDSERYFYGDINGTLLNLPFGPLKAAVGLEIREDYYANQFNDLVQDGYSGGGVSLPTSGGYDVKSYYAELQIPVVNNLPLVQALNLTPSFRYDDYSTFGGESTYKVGMDFEISSDVRLRATHSTALRAPRVSELFSGTSTFNPGAGGDPCETNPAYSANRNFGRGVLTAGSTCSRAVAGGAAVTNFTSPLDAIPNSVIPALQGGNPNLQPESADTFTGGFVLTPRWTPGLTVAADYYSIDLSDTILTRGVVGAVGPDFVLLQCYGPAQNELFCKDIIRDSNGNIVQINSLGTNIGSAKVEGIDYQISYNTRTANWDVPLIGGYFNLDLVMTNQLENHQTNADGSVSKFNGYFNPANRINQPKWKGVFTLDYLNGPWKARYDLRYSEKTSNFTQSVLSGVYGNVIPDMVYHDISVSYEQTDQFGAQQARLIFGVNNLFDKEPPFIATEVSCRCNALPGPFDMLGRYFYTRLSFQF